ncbi:MAG: hypothetical protein JWM28_3277 [Chitinophagaceae bacterium]|nr:hypothetical protein [Chitinophagaceae bacterium]
MVPAVPKMRNSFKNFKKYSPETVSMNPGDLRCWMGLADGVLVALNTVTTFLKKARYLWISDGKLKITSKERVLFFDFVMPNNGNCDNKALRIPEKWGG